MARVAHGSRRMRRVAVMPPTTACMQIAVAHRCAPTGACMAARFDHPNPPLVGAHPVRDRRGAAGSGSRTDRVACVGWAAMLPATARVQIAVAHGCAPTGACVGPGFDHPSPPLVGAHLCATARRSMARVAHGSRRMRRVAVMPPTTACMQIAVAHRCAPTGACMAARFDHPNPPLVGAHPVRDRRGAAGSGSRTDRVACVGWAAMLPATARVQIAVAHGCAPTGACVGPGFDHPSPPLVGAHLCATARRSMARVAHGSRRMRRVAVMPPTTACMQIAVAHRVRSYREATAS